MSSLQYESIVGKRKGSKLIYTSDHHLFNMKSQGRYVCHVKDCPAKIKIENMICSYTNSSHIHGTQETTYEEYKISDRVKERCLNETKRPREIFNEECATSTLPLQYAKRQRTYQKHQRKGIPKNPKTVDDVKSYFEQQEIRDRYGKSLNTNPKPFYNETVVTSMFAYVIFCSEVILQNLPPIRRLFIDGTFKVVPAGPFKQLLIIGIENDSHVSIFCMCNQEQQKIVQICFKITLSTVLRTEFTFPKVFS